MIICCSFFHWQKWWFDLKLEIYSDGTSSSDGTTDDGAIVIEDATGSTLKTQTGITVMAKSKWFNSVHVRGTEADINALDALTYVDSIDFADKSLNSGSREFHAQDKYDNFS